MDRRVWQAAVHGVTRIRHDWTTENMIRVATIRNAKISGTNIIPFYFVCTKDPKMDVSN